MKQSLRKGAKAIRKSQRSLPKNPSRSHAKTKSHNASEPVLIAIKPPQPSWKPDDKKTNCLAFLEKIKPACKTHLRRPSSSGQGTTNSPSRAGDRRRSNSSGQECSKSYVKIDVRIPSSPLQEAAKSPLRVRDRRQDGSAGRGKTRSARANDRKRASSPKQESIKSSARAGGRKRSRSPVQSTNKPSGKIDTRNQASPLEKAGIKSQPRATSVRKRSRSPAQQTIKSSREAGTKKRIKNRLVRLPLKSHTRSLKSLCGPRERKFTCPKCHKVFRRRQALKKHLQTHKGEKQHERGEPLLGKMTTSDEKLLRRKVRRLLYSLEPHSRRPRPPPMPPAVSPHPLHRLRAASCITSRISTPTSNPASCFSTPGRVLSASSTRTPGAVGVAGAVATAVPTSPTSAISRPRSNIVLRKARHMCPVCHMTFPWLCHLKTHILMHDVKVYRCNKCNFMTVKPEALTEHKFSHIEQGSARCNLCDAEFKSVRYLIRHINTDHGYPSL